MEKFANVLRELKSWLLSYSLVTSLLPLRLVLLFGGLGLIFFQELLFQYLPYSVFDVYNIFFNMIPLASIGTYAFLLGAWLTLISPDIKILPFGLWGKAFLILFPFGGWWFNPLIGAAIYAYLGYLLYKFSTSPHAAKANE